MQQGLHQEPDTDESQSTPYGTHVIAAHASVTYIAVAARAVFTMPRMDYQDGKTRFTSEGLEDLLRALAQAIGNGSPLLEQLRGRAANEIAERDRAREANFALARERWPIDAKILSRRDWQSFALRFTFLLGALSAIVVLILHNKFAESLQVFALVAGYFLGFADRGQTANQPPQQEPSGKVEQR